MHVIGGGEIGGAERHLLTLMELLDKEYFTPELLCLCRGPFAAACRAGGITTHEIIMRHKLDLGTVEPVRKLIREQGIDLVHTHGARANLVARIAAQQEGVPIVTTFHSVLRYDYQSRLEAFMARVLTRLTNGLTAFFIAVSGAVKEDLVGMGAAADRIRVIYNGLDLSGLVPEIGPAEVRARLQLPPEGRVVATVGRLHPVKGQVYFLEAAASLSSRFRDVVFMIVGEGQERPVLEQRIRELGLTDRVVLTGFYPHTSDLYPVMNVFCLPSLMEGMPLVVLEAMHFGVPVVAARVGGVPEVVTDGETGLLVPPENSKALAEGITRLLEEPELAAELAGRARERVVEFTVESMARQVEEIYREVIGGR